MQKWNFNKKKAVNVPKTYFWVLLCVLWSQNFHFMGPIKLKLCLSCKICIIFNRSKAKMGYFLKERHINVPKPHFQVLLWVL